jgi:glyoxylase-like metal-dependent hydrolase (beta-lactamase superfamily II)
MPQPLPVPGYLIQTEAGQNILVDTGFSKKFIRHPPAPEPAEMAMRPSEYIVDQLAAIGLAPAAARESTRKLMALAQRVEAKLVLFGHDSAQWAGLKKAPDFYS